MFARTDNNSACEESRLLSTEVNPTVLWATARIIN